MRESMKKSQNEINYEANNVAPPQHTEHEGVKINFSRQWRQEGNYIIRDGEEAKLGVKIPVNKILTGTDEQGRPILQDIRM